MRWLFLLSLLFATPAWASFNGVYDLTNFNSTVPASITNNASIDGCSIRITGWSTVEPSDGVFDWSLVDAMIARCSTAGHQKKIVITLPAGYTTPSWVYSAGAVGFNWVWDASFGPALCSTATMPLPWDTVFQSKWHALMVAFGAKYASNPNIVAIHITGPNNGKDAELLLPHKNTQYGIGTGGVTCGAVGGFQCCEGANDTNWKNAGYTRTKMETAMEWGMAEIVSAFPTTPISGEYEPCSIPSIDASGNIFVTPGDCGDTTGVYDVINYGRYTYPNGRFIWQSDSLSTSPYSTLSQMWTNMQTATTTAPVTQDAFQFASTVGGGATFTNLVNSAIGYNASALEAYETDLTNATNAAAITTAHNAMASAGTRYCVDSSISGYNNSSAPTGACALADADTGISSSTCDVDSTHRWCTMAKVKSMLSTFVASDTVSFKKGDVWNEQFDIASTSGSSGSPIVFQGYGTGSCWDTSPSGCWTIDGGNSRSYCVDSINPSANTVKYLTIDGLECRHATAQGITFQTFSSGTSTTMPGIVVQNSYVHNSGLGCSGSSVACLGTDPPGSLYVNQLDFQHTGGGGADAVQFVHNRVKWNGGHNCIQIHYDYGAARDTNNVAGPGCVHGEIDVKGIGSTATPAIVQGNIAIGGFAEGLQNCSPFCAPGYYYENDHNPDSNVIWQGNLAYDIYIAQQACVGGPLSAKTSKDTLKMYNNTYYAVNGNTNGNAPLLLSCSGGAGAGTYLGSSIDVRNVIIDGGCSTGNCTLNLVASQYANGCTEDYNDIGGAQGNRGYLSCGGSSLAAHDLNASNPRYLDAGNTGTNFTLWNYSPVINKALATVGLGGTMGYSQQLSGGIMQ